MRTYVLMMRVETDAPLEMLVDRGVWNNGSDWDPKSPGKQRSSCLEEVFYGCAIDVKKVIDVSPMEFGTERAPPQQPSYEELIDFVRGAIKASHGFSLASAVSIKAQELIDRLGVGDESKS